MRGKSVIAVSFALVLIMAGISLGCLPGEPAQAPVASVAPAGPGTYVFHPVREESGSIRKEGNMDANNYVAGDDEKNYVWRALCSFDISYIAGRDVTSAKFVFEGEREGDPFDGSLGPLLIWQVDWGSRALVPSDYKNTKSPVARLGSFNTESGEIDVSSHVREAVSSGDDRFQVKVQFERSFSNGNAESDNIVFDMRLEVSYE